MINEKKNLRIKVNPVMSHIFFDQVMSHMRDEQIKQKRKSVTRVFDLSQLSFTF